MHRLIAFTAVLTFLSLSCTAPSSGPATDTPPVQQTNATGTGSGPVAPPADAQWTIFCRAVSGASHVSDSRRLRDQLQASSGMRTWHLIHGAAESTLYYGYYSSVEESKNRGEARRAADDLTRIRQLTNTAGGRPFAQAAFVPLNSSEPPAPPEWDITNTGKHWSLQIAIYSDSPDRKQAAVDAVRAARAQGEEAYFYHGELASSVLIGAWPLEAVRMPQPKANTDRNKNVVLSTVPLPAQLQKRLNEDKNTVAVTPDVEPLDSKMIDAMKKYPYHYINGEVFQTRRRDTQTNRMIETPDKSFLVVIPSRSDRSVLADGDLAPPPIINYENDGSGSIYGTTPSTPQQQSGQLRQIGE